MLKAIKPMDIEKCSFEIITRELGDRLLDPENELVIKRVIHTTADFDYVENLRFSAHAVGQGLEALLGGEVHCFMSDPDVAEEARERGVTRAIVSMERAANLEKPCIFAIGNAPTALIALKELIDAGRVSPALVIGVPVGFVNVVESKELIMTADVPYIVARGRKGGSNVAAAICNAMLYQIKR